MKYEISGTEWSQELTARTGPLRREWQLQVDGTDHAVTVEAFEGNRVLRLTHEGQTHTLTILPGNRPGQPVRFLLDDEYHELGVRDETDLLTDLLGGPDGGGGAEELFSPMPGVIRKLLVQTGDSVEADQPLLILEAMKMENEVRSPRAGVVGRLHVAEGDTVAAGQELAVIDGTPAPG